MYPDRMEQGTQTSDGDSAMTIARIVPVKPYYPGDHTRLYVIRALIGKTSIH